eukprot:scaffold3426_cov145-Amphora_coffeaeformis.AAC.8
MTRSSAAMPRLAKRVAIFCSESNIDQALIVVNEVDCRFVGNGKGCVLVSNPFLLDKGGMVAYVLFGSVRRFSDALMQVCWLACCGRGGSLCATETVFGYHIILESNAKRRYGPTLRPKTNFAIKSDGAELFWNQTERPTF